MTDHQLDPENIGRHRGSAPIPPAAIIERWVVSVKTSSLRRTKTRRGLATHLKKHFTREGGVLRGCFAAWFFGGLCPPNPRDLPHSRQNSWVASQLGAAPPNPCWGAAEGRRVRRLPAIPAAESALGLRPRRALSSAQVFPACTISTSPCNQFCSQRRLPNWLSHDEVALPLPFCPPFPPPLGRPRCWVDLSGFTNWYLTKAGLLIEAPEGLEPS